MKARFPWHRIDMALPLVEYNEAVMLKIKSRCRMLENDCWEYLGTRNEQGYGFINYRGKSWPIHRLTLTIIKGSPPTPKHKACHECDFPPCCNSDHLFWGTQKANGEDMAAKGRAAKQQNTACPRGHLYSDHGRINPKTGWRACKMCERAKQRIYQGWPEDLAYSAPRKQGWAPKDMVRVEPPLRRRDRTVCASGHKIEGHNAAPKTNGGVQCRICYNASAYRNRAAKGLAVANPGEK